MRTRIGAVVGLALTVLVMPLFAHHSIGSTYEIDKSVTLKGIVTKVEWQNPHVILHLDVKNDDGSIVGWTVETLPARGLMSRGLDRDFIKAGDTVGTNVFVAKDGAQRAAFTSTSWRRDQICEPYRHPRRLEEGQHRVPRANTTNHQERISNCDHGRTFRVVVAYAANAPLQEPYLPGGVVHDEPERHTMPAFWRCFGHS